MKGKGTKMFYDNYIPTVFNGLRKMQASGRDGGNIEQENAIRLWCERAKKVRDELHGLTFFCGNGASASMAEHMSHDWFQNAKMNTYTCSENSRTI